MKEDYKTHISIIIPSRNRPSRLLECLDSLFSLRDLENENFEVLVKIDFDDFETIKNIEKFQKYQKELSFIVSDRLVHGWENIRDYINDLIYYSKGKYVFSLNDDVVLLTKNWNTILEEEAKEEKIYFVNNNGAKESFFYMPRRFHDILDKNICPHNQIDTYLRDLARITNIDVYFNLVTLQHYNPEYAGFGPSPRDPELFKDSSWREKVELSRKNCKKRDSHESRKQLHVDAKKIQDYLLKKESKE